MNRKTEPHPGIDANPKIAAKPKNNTHKSQPTRQNGASDEPTEHKPNGVAAFDTAPHGAAFNGASKKAAQAKPAKKRPKAKQPSSASAPKAAAPKSPPKATKKPSKAAKKSRQRKTAGQDREYLIRDDGVYVRTKDEETDEFVEAKICALLAVRAHARNGCDDEWSRILEWTSPSGELHRWVMPMSQIALDDRQIIARLMAGGLWIAAGHSYSRLVVNYIQTAPVEDKWECVATTGWHRNSFVLPDAVTGPEADQLIFQAAVEQQDLYRVRGTLDEWRHHVARYCVSNSRLVLVVSSALTGPLMDVLEMVCAGVHFGGLSSEGKTTTLYVGGSVLGGGGPLHFCQSWKATINGLEAMAALHNGAALFLDELQSVDAHQAAECVYMLSAGIGKTRMSKTAQGLRPRLEWRLLFVSSGELSLADHVATAGKRLRGGAEVRMIYIPANADKGLGLFEDLHTDDSGCSSGHEFAQLLAENTNHYYGTALRAWLEILTGDLASIRERAQVLRRAFVEQHRPLDQPGEASKVAGEVLRVLDTFACIAAAGELATEEGITGWQRGEANQACAICFAAWQKRRGVHGSSDLEAAVRQVRLFCERYEVSHFEILGVTPEAREYRVIQDRAGYRKTGTAGETLRFYVSPEAWKTEVCKGYDAQAVAQELQRRKLLQAGPDRLQYSKRIKGKLHRVYALSGKILEGERCGTKV